MKNKHPSIMANVSTIVKRTGYMEKRVPSFASPLVIPDAANSSETLNNA